MNASAKVTAPGLRKRKQEGRKITMLTAYDASFARLIDRAGIDCVLVGDSLGNVIQGRSSTVPVTVSDMVYHVAAVRRGLSRALLLADMPFMSYHDRATAMRTATELMQAGAEMVKLEGGEELADTVAALVSCGIPVCGHLGLTPQHVHQLGGYRVQGRGDSPARALMASAERLVDAGAAMLVVECIPHGLARQVAEQVAVPVIGIGAGADVDGQVLVLHDMLGVTPEPRPRFVHDFLAESGSIENAFRAYARAVVEGQFPAEAHRYEDQP